MKGIAEPSFCIERRCDKNDICDGKDYIFVAAYSTDNQLLSTDYVQAKFVDNYTCSFGFHFPAQSKKNWNCQGFCVAQLFQYDAFGGSSLASIKPKK